MPVGLTGGAAVVRPAVPLDFTDGDTLKRFTITDSFVTTTDTRVIIGGIRRTTIADVDDPGWIYTANVVSVTATTASTPGTFDILVSALAGDAVAGVNEFPNETVTFTYLLQ